MTRTELRTYSHLAGANRVPTSYELLSSQLLYYPHHGFSVNTPCDEWYERYQAGSPLASDDWEAFADPAATTYSDYVVRQRDREVALDGGLGDVLDTPPSRDWLEVLHTVFAPLRYPGHGLMMAAAYVGSMAPGGKIVITSALQAADEMRRVHRFAQQLAQYRGQYPGIGDSARQAWETDPSWRTLRRMIERLLCTYDWGECLAALNLAIKPTFDLVVCRAMAAAARGAGDHSLALILSSLDDDAAWHRDWTCQLVRECVANDSRRTLVRWIDSWRPVTEDALGPLGVAMGAQEHLPGIREAHDDFLARCGLEIR